jgi:hypothetical protein
VLHAVDTVHRPPALADDLELVSGGRLDRWRKLALQLYDNIEPLITDADTMLVEGEDLVKTRDYLWRGIVECRA